MPKLRDLLPIAVSLLATIWTRDARAQERYVFESLFPPGQFAIPGSVAVSKSGVVYVADPRNNRVQVFDGSATPKSLSRLCCYNVVDAGTGLPIVTGASIQLDFPVGVAVDPRDETVWITNSGAHGVVKVTKAGILTHVFFGRLGSGSGQFEFPHAVAVDPQGNLYVADGGGHTNNLPVNPANIRIQKFTPNGTFVRAWGSFCRLNANGTPAVGACNTSAPGAAMLGDGQFSPVSGLATDSMSNVYVTEEGNSRVQKFDTNGVFLTKWGSNGSGDGQFDRPLGLAVDFADNVFVVESRNDRIQKFNGTGTFLSKGASKGTASGFLDHPLAIAATPPGLVAFCKLLGFECAKLYVAELANARVHVFLPKPDADGDSILDEVDNPTNVASNNYGSGATFGTITARGQQTFTFSAPSAGTISVKTESFGGVSPLVFTMCGPATATLGAGAELTFHCSNPTIEVGSGPATLDYVAPDGTRASAVLHAGDNLTVRYDTSAVVVNSGNVVVYVQGNPVTAGNGQTVLLDGSAPVTTATGVAAPSPGGWTNTPATVQFKAADNVNGSGVKSVIVALSGAENRATTTEGDTASVTIATEGVTKIAYHAVDRAGRQEAPRELVVKIDRTPPVLSGLPAQCTVWPRNHRLVRVAQVGVLDALAGLAAGSPRVTVTSSEAEAGLWDGDEGPDVLIRGKTVKLRAERAGQTPRVYTITASGTDRAGNVATASATCRVAKPGP